MNGYSFTVDCMECGARLVPVQNPAPTIRTLAVAVAECPTCGQSWEVQVVLRAMVYIPREGCGTLRKYRNGCRCRLCKKASRDHRRRTRLSAGRKHGTQEMVDHGCSCSVCGAFSHRLVDA